MWQRCFILIQLYFCVIRLCLKLRAICLFPSHIFPGPVMPVKWYVQPRLSVFPNDGMFYPKSQARTQSLKTKGACLSSTRTWILHWVFRTQWLVLSDTSRCTWDTFFGFSPWARPEVMRQLCSGLHDIFSSIPKSLKTSKTSLQLSESARQWIK